MHRYRLITFDVTGTILKFKHPPGVDYAKVGAKYGLHAKPEQLTASFKTQWKHLNHTKPNFGLAHCGWQDWWREAVHGTFKGAGIHCEDPELLDQVAQQLIEKYTTSTCWQHCDGAVEILTELKARSVPLGVVSNFDGRLEAILENMGVRRFFDFVVTSYEVGHSKPSPGIFEAALKKHGGGEEVQGEGVLHVGDTKELDCGGAEKMGWHSWLVLPSSPSVNKQNLPHTKQGTLRELQTYLSNP